MKNTENLTSTAKKRIRRLVEKESTSVLEQFNVDCDGYEISNNLRETLEYRHIDVNEETLTYLAKVIYGQLDEELENADE